MDMKSPLKEGWLKKKSSQKIAESKLKSQTLEK